MRSSKRRIDPSVKDVYEPNPYDPLAAARMLGKFLGAVVSFDRKMNPLVMGGSIVLGLGLLIPGLISGNVFGTALGVSILLNVARNIKAYYL